jgi:predicted N-acetyltransferase YhbS
MSPLTVRPFHSAEEASTYYRLTEEAFVPNPTEEGAQRWQRFLQNSPDFRPEQVRGVFRDEQLLGGYTMHERMLCMGGAHISTGCIGAVVTTPAFRKQGVATAIMRDAFAFARERGHALLLLDGIPNFYFRYDYIDIFDVTNVEVERAAILAQPPTLSRVRAATVDDAPALLALYQRHFGGYTGTFERSLESQAYRLSHGKTPRLVALSERGSVEGYLFPGTEDELHQGRELAADSWDAQLALLQYHARQFEDATAPRTLLYFLPLSSPLTEAMIDTLEVPNTSHWQSSAEEWGVRSLAYHHRFTGWMARLVDFPALMQAIVPELQFRWRRSLAQWSGNIGLQVNSQVCTFNFDGVSLRLVEEADCVAPLLELTPQALLQLLFGYRSLDRLANSVHLSREAHCALAILFPTGHTWIPCSDWF